YKNYYRTVKRIVQKSSGNEDQARDIFQEVIIVIYNKLQDNKFEITSSFFTFFYGVINKIWLNYRKLNSKNPLGYAIDFNDEIGVDSSNQEVEILARKALRNQLFYTYFRQLTMGCQEILQLFLVETNADKIAQILDLKNANYVRKRKANCLETLLNKIRKDWKFKELI
ncbi:MAG: sigma-70 family RNA polymerase sigma factor, partial [Bacteroidales bacterium]|nr:sigma-70 family RNA polymerase sigma factor [Bacteroidales bacterium]